MCVMCVLKKGGGVGVDCVFFVCIFKGEMCACSMCRCVVLSVGVRGITAVDGCHVIPSYTDYRPLPPTILTSHTQGLALDPWHPEVVASFSDGPGEPVKLWDLRKVSRAQCYLRIPMYVCVCMFIHRKSPNSFQTDTLTQQQSHTYASHTGRLLLLLLQREQQHRAPRDPPPAPLLLPRQPFHPHPHALQYPCVRSPAASPPQQQ